MALAEHGTDLVPTNGALAAVAQIENIERLLPEALERGDTDWLLNIARKAEVAALWAKREDYQDEGNRMMRLKVRAEACMGSIDRQRIPKLVAGCPPLMLDGEPAPRGTRDKWRRLAVALERGVLDQAMDAVERRGGDISTWPVDVEVRAQGAGYVPAGAVRDLIDARLAVTKQSRRALAVEIGVDPHRIHAVYYPSRANAEPRVEWDTARAVAGALGEDPRVLPIIPLARARVTGRRVPRWLTRERKPTGSKWDSPYAHFRKALADIKHLAPNTVSKYDELYAHLYAIEEFVAREMKRG
jgi:hypothetical protein